MRTLLVAAGALLIVAMAVAALGKTLSLGLSLADAPAGRFGLAGWGALLGGALTIGAAVSIGFAIGRSRLTDRAVVMCGLAVILLARGGVVLVMDAPLANDGVAYRDLAIWLADGGCCFADRPTGYPALLAPLYALFGPATWVAEVVNVVAAIVGGWLLFDVVRRASGRTAAATALFAFAVLPGLLLLTPLLLTDTVYATLLISAVWAVSRVSDGPVRYALATGAVLGLSQYVRPVAPALLAAVALALLLAMDGRRARAVVLAALAISFVVVTAPVAARNVAEHGDLSVSTSSYGGWSLLMGTNQSANGRYNRADADLVDGLPGATLWEKSRRAGEIGLRRITSDPPGFAALAVRKFSVMWGTEDFAVGFAFRDQGRPRGALAGLDVLAQFGYLGLLIATAAGALWAVRRGPGVGAVAVVVLALLLTEAAIHTFLEVKPRYHALAEPLLLIVAAPALAVAVDRVLRTGSRARAGRRSG